MKTEEKLKRHLISTGQSPCHVSPAMLFLCEEMDKMQVVTARHTRQIHDLKYNRIINWPDKLESTA